VDYVQAIHLVAAAGIEFWIERDERITDSEKLNKFYPCLAFGNIHYDTRLFNAVLVSAGSMGVIYSVILRTVPLYASQQHRVGTTWEALLAADPNLASVMDGSFMANSAANANILFRPLAMNGPFAPNTFSQIVINPYPFFENDATLLPLEQAMHD